MHPAAMPARTPGAWFPWRCIDRKYLITTARFPETWTAATLLPDRLTSSGHSAEPANIVGTEPKRPIPTNLPRILNDMSRLWRVVDRLVAVHHQSPFTDRPVVTDDHSERGASPVDLLADLASRLATVVQILERQPSFGVDGS